MCEQKYLRETPCGTICGTDCQWPGVAAYKGIRYATAERYHRHHRFMPADRSVNHRVADFVASKPQFNAPAHRSLIGHDKRHCRPVRLICRNLVTHRAG